MRPQDHRQLCIVTRDTVYAAVETVKTGEGTLERGRVVWIMGPLVESREAAVSAYVEGLGVISIDPRCLS